MLHENWLKIRKQKDRRRRRVLTKIYRAKRLAMLKYGINDLRAFFETDYRWLNHFGFDPLDVPSNYRGLSR